MDYTGSQCWVGWSYGTLASFKVGEGFTLEWSWLWNGWEDNVGQAPQQETKSFVIKLDCSCFSECGHIYS